MSWWRHLIWYESCTSYSAIQRIRGMMNSSVEERVVRVSLGEVTLDGDLAVPGAARGLVLFAHGSGSSRHSPRNRFVAGVLHEEGLATLLLDLLTATEG